MENVLKQRQGLLPVVAGTQNSFVLHSRPWLHEPCSAICGWMNHGKSISLYLPAFGPSSCWHWPQLPCSWELPPVCPRWAGYCAGSWTALAAIANKHLSAPQSCFLFVCTFMFNKITKLSKTSVIVLLPPLCAHVSYGIKPKLKIQE